MLFVCFSKFVLFSDCFNYLFSSVLESTFNGLTQHTHTEGDDDEQTHVLRGVRMIMAVAASSMVIRGHKKGNKQKRRRLQTHTTDNRGWNTLKSCSSSLLLQ